MTIASRGQDLVAERAAQPEHALDRMEAHRERRAHAGGRARAVVRAVADVVDPGAVRRWAAGAQRSPRGRRPRGVRPRAARAGGARARGPRPHPGRRRGDRSAGDEDHVAGNLGLEPAGAEPRDELLVAAVDLDEQPLGALAQLDERPGADHPAGVEDHDRVADPLDLLEVVRRDDDVDPELGADPADQGEHVVALDGVEPVGRLVEQDERAGRARSPRPASPAGAARSTSCRRAGSAPRRARPARARRWPAGSRRGEGSRGAQ